jgi:hypothetical protein
VLRFVLLAVAVVWVVATIGRVTRQLGQSTRSSVRGASPAPSAPPRSDRLISLFRTVIGILLVLLFGGALWLLTDLPDLAVVLIAAPVAGMASSAITERFVVDVDD